MTKRLPNQFFTGPCPCGSGQNYGVCCRPYHGGQQRAATAEYLMRSRYSAYAGKLDAYLLETWHSTTRPTSLALDNDSTRWYKLKILDTREGNPKDDRGSVEFEAYFIQDGKAGCLHETSRFQREDGAWRYLDGATQMFATAVGRNESCPCGSGKKFKRCCGD